MTQAAHADVTETNAGRFWLEDGILRFVSREGAEQEEQDAVDSMAIFTRLAAGKRLPVVMVITGVKRLSREARQIYTGELAARTFTAAAIVSAGSAVERALFNFIITVGKPAYPSRMFNHIDDAIRWAREHALPG